jgi:hypothetical protein
MLIGNGPLDDGKRISLGFGKVSIRVPSNWEIDKKMPVLENETYLFRRGSSTVLTIVLSASDSERDDFGKPASPYCVSGFRGVTRVEDGIRKILLFLPQGHLDRSAYFELQDRDSLAMSAVRSFRSNIWSGHC